MSETDELDQKYLKQRRPVDNNALADFVYKKMSSAQITWEIRHLVPLKWNSLLNILIEYYTKSPRYVKDWGNFKDILWSINTP